MVQGALWSDEGQGGMDARDVARLDYLCGRGRCVPLGIIHDGNTDGRNIGLRHDCDDNGIRSMVELSKWETSRSRFSTYYLLHTAEWWGTNECIEAVAEILDGGHEVGLHHNALAVWWRTKRNPFDVFEEALDQLRVWCGPNHPIRSVAGHGDPDCYVGQFVNYTMFGMRSSGHHWRDFSEVTGMTPRPIEEFGVEFHGDHVPRAMYISDSGGSWTHDLTEVAKDFPFESNTVILQHPDWYGPELFNGPIGREGL